jgi:hypothetical protein
MLRDEIVVHGEGLLVRLLANANPEGNGEVASVSASVGNRCLPRAVVWTYILRVVGGGLSDMVSSLVTL